MALAAAVVILGLGCGQPGVTIAGGSGGTTSSGGGQGASAASSGGVSGGGTGGAAGSVVSGGSGGATTTTGSGGSAGSAGSAAGISILAWNLESFPLTPEAPALIEGVLADLLPDVVGVEEIKDDAAFIALAAALPGYAAVIADDPTNFTRAGLLYRSESVVVSDVEILFEDNSFAFPRPPLKAHIAVNGQGFDFDFLVIHLKAQIDAASEARRRAGCEALAGWIEERLLNGDDTDVILAGDFNDKITDPPEHNVFQVFLDQPAQYRFLTQPVADAGDYSYIPFTSLIDHVLVTTSVLAPYGAGTTQAVPLEETVPDYENKVSDHRPILTRFAAP